MITIKKLKTLNNKIQKRKIAVLLQDLEQQLTENKNINKIYLKNLNDLIIEQFRSNDQIKFKSDKVYEQINSHTDIKLRRCINSLRHEILKVLGTEPADWDLTFFSSPIKNNTTNQGQESNFELFLDDVRSPFNVGSIFRTAEAFGVSKIFLSPDCPSPEHPRAKRTAMGAVDMIEWHRSESSDCFNSAIENGQAIFGLELGGESIFTFDFPKSGLAVIGSEELGISPEARAAVNKSLGLISIPIYGKKGSLNVSSAFAIMMHSWRGFAAK